MAVEIETPDFTGFYEPSTSREVTVAKLQALRVKPMAEITNADLFEAIADTFVTIATEDFKAGRVSDDGFKADEWESTDEVYPSGDNGPCIGYWRDPAEPREERVFIARIVEDYAIYIDRSPDSSTSSCLNSNEDGDDIPHEVTDAEKEAILGACLAGFSSQP